MANQGDNHVTKSYTGPRHDMVRWYSPAMLARMGLRSAISTTIGQVADNREVRAALFPGQEIFDHSNDEPEAGAQWIDYVADIGDGWQSTLAVASALNAPYQDADGEAAPRGSLLVMGGDEVYPEPSASAYAERTIAPWNEACRHNEAFSTRLYAVPGNHDWYDGLHAFTEVFCRAGRTGPGAAGATFDNHVCPQCHSYFTLKLQAGWWLCGIDIQLNRHIDSSQYAYFERIAAGMKKGDQLILCAPTPSWVREVTGDPGISAVLASIASLLTANGAELRLVLTGDLHHYSRYGSGDGRLSLITAGGGGAFLHPTHKLPQKTAINWSADRREEFSFATAYPDARTSRALSYKNLAFPLINKTFAAALGAIYMVLAWFLITRQTGNDTTLDNVFMEVALRHKSIPETFRLFFQTIPKSPEFAIVALGFTSAFVAFNLTRNITARFTIGLLHSFVHIMALAMAYCVAILLVSMLPVRGALIDHAVFFFTVFVLGAVSGGLIFGAYLLAALNIAGWQWTNAFSSLRIAGYKNFLRLKIDADGTLTVYAFGIDDVSRLPPRVHLADKLTIEK